MGRDCPPPTLRRSGPSYLNRHTRIPLGSTVCLVSNNVPGLGSLRSSGRCVNRRLADRIRELCALAVAARHEDEREIILAELSSALHEHVPRPKRKAVLNLVEHADGFEERRTA